MIAELFYTVDSHYPFVMEEGGEGPSKIEQAKYKPYRENSKHFKVLYTPVWLMAHSLS